MIKEAALTAIAALSLACISDASVLVPTYVLPPDSFIRDQRSLKPPPPSIDSYDAQRTIKRLIGGHMKIKSGKEYGAAKNSIDYDEKSENSKFSGVVVPELTRHIISGNQGIWDDGMLMSSAGGGKEAMRMTDDEDKKTLSDQVVEGKYGLIQDEIFHKTPKRPGIVSYLPNMETRSKDNIQNLGGLKKDEIWLAEDHLLVLKGGAFDERIKNTQDQPWKPIDNYEAPRRQVKLPEKPKVPPPFPVRLTDNGPLVFLTPNGSVPAALFPPYPSGESESSLSSPPFPFAQNPPNSPSNYQGNFTSGGTSLPVPTFPFLPGNASEGASPFFPSINGSFPEGFPPGAVFLPPPSNQSDLYDEEDPSIYYPPPYNFSYHADNNNIVPAGPLVPGIILPPPPDFFAPMEEMTTKHSVRPTEKPTVLTSTKSTPTRRPSTSTISQRNKYKNRPSGTTRLTERPTTTKSAPPVESEVTTTMKYPSRVVNIPSRNPIRVHNLPVEIPSKVKTEKPLKMKPKVPVVYNYPQETYSDKPPTTSSNPFIVYSIPGKIHNVVVEDPVTSTPVTLTAYFSKGSDDYVPTTKLKPVYHRKPNDNTLASFYFYDEQSKTSPSAEPYFDGRNYYNTAPVNQAPEPHNINPETGFTPVDISYGGTLDQADTLFLWPQKQGPRTLTQEYFSIQKPQLQTIYSHSNNQRPNSFYQQIADIQQTIDLITTKRPKAHRSHYHKAKAINSRPVYQYSYQTKQRPEHYSFRVPKLDPEPFRPMVSYSKPFNVENEFNAITPSITPNHQQYLIENVQVPTTSPNPTKLYSKPKTKDEDYQNRSPFKSVKANKNSNHIQVQNEKPIIYSNRFPSTTPNPIDNGYYTKQDEKYLDEITKNSFDVFGKKLEDNRDNLGVTPSLQTVRTPVNNNINLQYAYEVIEPENPPSLEKDTLINDQPRPINPDSEPVLIHPNGAIVQSTKPLSLLGDTLVNERPPLPTIDPDSEFVPIPNPVYRPAQQYRVQNSHYTRSEASEQFDLNAPSLAGDTAVNYKRPLPALNPDAEWITPVNAAGEGRPGSFISYRLPGDGAHVYFLTPQAARVARSRAGYRSPGYK